MAEEMDRLNELFRSGTPERSFGAAEGNEDQRPKRRKKKPTSSRKKAPIRASVDRFLTDKDSTDAVNFTGDDESERDYRPVRQSQEGSVGCLGGLMYFAFVLCLSVLLAAVGWMAASDALALNQEVFEAEVALPSSIFQAEESTAKEDGGKVSVVTHADMDYVASALKEAGLIQYKWLFKLFSGFSHADTKLDPGSYTLKSTYDYRALIKHMQAGAGNALTVTVTIPEGFTMHQIFKRLEENYVSTYDELMAAAASANFNYDFIKESGNASRLEGYLFPDTYEFYVHMQASSAINKMLNNFNNRVTEEMRAQAEASGRSLSDVIKVASLIEKEAANDEERPLIASVIYNRLSINMSIGLESAILYVHQDHVGAPTTSMITEESPYNLLVRTGLTPTPISNPGLASINAALHPSTTDYLYFTLDTASGTHRFFNNADDFYSFVATQDYG